MFLKKLIILQILNILTNQSKALKTKNSMTRENYKPIPSGTFYFNTKRPLWILHDPKEDEKHLKPQVNSLNYPNTQEKEQQQNQQVSVKAQKHSSHIKKYKGLQLPYDYIPVRRASKHDGATSSRRYKNSKFIKNMPVFDAAPGDDTFSQTRPIFIYTGNKGRMLLNTMLSKRKYPMQEPVPGQILYPPPALTFQPKVLVDDLQQQLNVTMIPFYAYEAIDPRRAQNQQVTTTSTSSSASSFTSGKNFQRAKQYVAFHSPQEVLSQPVTDLSQYYNQLENTTNTPLTLEKPYANHRLANMPLSTTTPLTHKKFEVTYNDGEDKFQITYEDDAQPHLERPLNIPTTQFTTTKAPLPHDSYIFDKNYYAFPVYTMAKLLEKEDNAQQHLKEARKSDKRPQQRIEKSIDAALKEENDGLLKKANEDTWFILNSRYKGRLNTNNLHSSKYVQTSPLKLQDDMDLVI